MWHVAWFLDQKCPEATYKAYCAIRSFITFHGIFMGPGYGLGDGSVWREKQEIDEDEDEDDDPEECAGGTFWTYN